MDCIKKEFVRTDADGHKWWRVTLTATETPESLDELTGADVDGMSDNIRFAAGSVLLTPDGNSVFYSDGWSGGEGGGDLASIAITLDLGGGITVPVECTPELPGSIEWAKLSESEKSDGIMYSGETGEGLMVGTTYTITVTPSEAWYVYNPDDSSWGGQGETVSFSAPVEEEGSLSFSVTVANIPDFDDPEKEVINVYATVVAGGK